MSQKTKSRCSRESRAASWRRHAAGLLVALALAGSPTVRAQNSCYTDEVLVANQDVLGLSVATNGIVYYADYFGGTFGFLDLATDTLSTLVSGLKGPSAVAAFGDKVYFTESGTDAGHYHDGTLSVFDVPTATRTVLSTGLQYPDSLFVDNSGNVYVLEAAGTSTSYGGNNRLIEFAAGSSQYQVVIPSLITPAGVGINSQGTIFVGSWGSTIPGDGGKLFAYAPGSGSPVTVASGLPAIGQVAIDCDDNIYLAGFG